MAKSNNTFTEKWGANTAQERYAAKSNVGPARPAGSGQKALIGLIDQPKLDECGRVMQAPQAVNDQHCPEYDNDSDGWVRGMGKQSPYPHFDKGREGKN